MEEFDEQWYWDRRTNKAYYPVEIDEDSIKLVTVWHRDEVRDAIESDALAPLKDVHPDRTEMTFDLIDSFRLPADIGDD